MGIQKGDMKELKLYKNPNGTYTDGEGRVYWIPSKEEFAPQTRDWKSEGGLDISGSVTITGNLVVQQSDSVYLRGPITGSAARINGPIIAQSAEIGGVDILQKLNELEWKLAQLESGSGK